MMHVVTCRTMATPGTRDRQRQSGTCRAARKDKGSRPAENEDRATSKLKW